MGGEIRQAATSYYERRTQASAFIENNINEGPTKTEYLEWQVQKNFGFGPKFVRQYIATLCSIGVAVIREDDTVVSRSWIKARNSGGIPQ
jgi:hypothetical protein